MAQLPSGAAGAAAGVLIWSFTCLILNAVLLWLLWTSNERRSYIFFLSIVTFLSSTTSIIEQINDIAYWNDAMTARLAWIKADSGNPMLAASDGGTGLGLVMWTIRWGCYVAEAGLAFFWAFSLTQAVYCWRDDIRLHKSLTFINKAGKPFALFIATLTMSVLQAKSLQSSYTWWNFVLNFFYCTFCGGGMFMFLLILLEYIQTRRMFRRMNTQQRKEYLHEPSFVNHHTRSLSNATSIITMARRQTNDDSSEHFGALQQRQGGIYDKYLIARTFIPFMALSLFEIDNILINNSRPAKMRALALTSSPDLTTGTAISYLVGFIPGCLASLILPMAFGTTKQFRDKLYHTFVPVRFQSPDRRRSHEYSVFVDMDSDAGILSRQRRLSMEKKLRIEVTYEFEVRTQVVSSEVVAAAEKGRKLGIALDEEGAGGSGSWKGGTSMSEKAPATVGLQQVTERPRFGKSRASPTPESSNWDRPLPPTPTPEMTMVSKQEPASQPTDLSSYPFSVDSSRWDDTARILPKKPSISFMRGQL